MSIFKLGMKKGEPVVNTLKDMQNNNELRDIFIDYAKHFIGTFYSWGGSSVMQGFDCSGFVLECLQAVGLAECKRDYTADGLKNKYIKQQVPKPYRGCLVMWYATYNPNKAIHIEICLNDKLAIGARGGGSRTLSKEDAIRDNAFIKQRPIKSRLMIWGYVDPFKEIK